MANTFWREPTNHGDSNAWHDYIINQVRRGPIGALSLKLYSNGSVLTLSAGRAGIDDGVTHGAILCTTPTALSLAAITAGHWAKIELSVSGTAVTINVTEMADVSEIVIPAAIIAGYDYAKQGYYLTATKRLVGIAYKNAGGTLNSIINCADNKDELKNTEEKIGIIKQFDASTWVDDSTMRGWYACIAANAAYGCPDMLDRVPQGKLVAGAGAAGGANTKVIAAANLPPHVHTVATYANATGVSIGAVQATTIIAPVSTSNGGFANTALDIENANYTMVFVRKCYYK